MNNNDQEGDSKINNNCKMDHNFEEDESVCSNDIIIESVDMKDGVTSSSVGELSTMEFRCNIHKMSLTRLLKEYGKHGLPPLYEKPIIIRYDFEKNASDTKYIEYMRFLQKTSLTNITHTMGEDFMVELSSSNSYSSHRKKTSLKAYVEDMEETIADQKSNETWYLFGETHSAEWRSKLLEHYQQHLLPPCQTCNADLSALSFGIGGMGSGVQWHFHGPGFSETIHGKKHFLLYPPHKQPTFDPDFNARHWIEEIYPSLSLNDRPWECTLYPGEFLYFPDQWHHATLNLDPYNVFVSTFTTEVGMSTTETDYMSWL